MDLLIFIFFYQVAAAKDDWFCTSGASVRRGPTIEACGIGTGNDEANARASAFEAAQSEFIRVCTASADCDPSSQSVTPMRTQCSMQSQRFVCHRMLSFHQIQIRGREPGSLASAKSPQLNDARRIRRWMNKKELLSIFGEPDDVFDQAGSVLYNYRKPFCSDVCSVKIMLDHVVEYRGFRPVYSGEFD